MRVVCRIRGMSVLTWWAIKPRVGSDRVNVAGHRVVPIGSVSIG